MKYREIQMDKMTKAKQQQIDHSETVKTESASTLKKQSKKSIAKKLLFNKVNFVRKQLYFLMINTIQIALTLFNMLSIINIEAQDSLKQYEATSLLHFNNAVEGTSIYFMIFFLLLVHLIRLITSLVGYFCVYQKSGRLLSLFMFMGFICVITRGIITILLLINYKQVELVCQYEFGNDVATRMALQFMIILGFFMVVEILLGLIAFLLASDARIFFNGMKKDLIKVRAKYDSSYDQAINIYKL